MKIANKIVMSAAGLVLIIAAVLKSHQLLTEPIISDSFWESWLFFVIQIPLELGLGIWLLCGLFRKAAWLIAVFSFMLFVGVTLQKGLIGAASCGCFGTVHVNPWITLFTLDIPVLFALLIFRPKGQKLLPPPWPSAGYFFAVAIPTVILLTLTVVTIVFNRPPEKTTGYEVVRPQQWLTEQSTLDEQWPLLKHIDIADKLRNSIAVVVLIQYQCEQCHEVIPHYEQLCDQLAGNEDSLRIAFVEIPPYAPANESLIPAQTACLTGKLDTSKKWYIKTPLAVLIENGKLISFWEDHTPSLDEILDMVFSEI